MTTTEYSEFNQGLIKTLQNRITTLEVTPLKKHVTLSGMVYGKRVIFAALRSPSSRKADVRLYGYLETDTGLSKPAQKALAPEGVNDYFLKLDASPAIVAGELASHWKDVKGRVEAYAKKAGVKKGETPKRKWEARGIPFSYFQD